MSEGDNPAGDAKAPEIGGASARGASHIRRGKPNQDAFGGFKRSDWALIAVADGHGAENCFRSERGSRLVIESVKDVCASAVAQGAEAFCADFSVIPQRIVETWRNRVAEDAARAPDQRLPTQDPFAAYGATCVAALIGPGISLFLQIGDGDLVAASPGQDLAAPLPDDEGLIGEQTYSICLPDAEGMFRVMLFTTPHPLSRPDFVAVSTDGLAKSFVNNVAFLETMRQWRALIAKHGIASAEPQMEGWLSQCSVRGSGDDISLMIYTHGSEGPD